jgi:hypothetical protein
MPQSTGVQPNIGHCQSNFASVLHNVAMKGDLLKMKTMASRKEAYPKQYKGLRSIAALSCRFLDNNQLLSNEPQVSG